MELGHIMTKLAFSNKTKLALALTSLLVAPIAVGGMNSGAPFNSLTAVAGNDITVTDSGGNGSELITLNGQASFSPNGNIADYVWKQNGSEIVRGQQAQLNLNVGTHIFTLEVSDHSGQRDSDTVTINVVSPVTNKVDVWLTTDRGVIRGQESKIDIRGGNSTNNTKITLNENQTYQSMVGFGFAFTQGSTELLMRMSEEKRLELLNELFHPVNGNGIDVVRISLAASDLSTSEYSYNSMPGDVNMNHFSLDGPDAESVIPVLKEIIAINPDIKILSTPWSAPMWMKDNNARTGGSLRTDYHSAYARYFIKYLDAMAAHGIYIWAVTPQNEPENPWNLPSMTMSASQQFEFIDKFLGPAIEQSGHNTIIIGFDHNANNMDYPIEVARSRYVDGSAFHLYDGDISALTTVKQQTNKNIYFTEQFTGDEGSFGGDFGWHMNNIILGSVQNWARTAIEWNLVTTPNSLHCKMCLGAFDIDPQGNNVTRNVSYYIISQVSKYVDQGAFRIDSQTSQTDLNNVAFKNPDGSKSIVVYNKEGSTHTFSVQDGDQHFEYTLPPWSAASFRWNKSSHDMDSDGIWDITDNCKNISNKEQLDVDADGLGDLCDNDLDNDGHFNSQDNCPNTLNFDQADSDFDGIGDVCDEHTSKDSDFDGIFDEIDNCVSIANAKQANLDGDSFGDLCDDDIDGDSFSNDEEMSKGSDPFDALSIPVVIKDQDHDGIIDQHDNCPFIANPGQWDKDKDAIGNECDDDIDGDACPNIKEPMTQWNASLNGCIISPNDPDGDGIDNVVDNCPTIMNPGQWDKDKDGIGNECDNDIDGDSCANHLEPGAEWNSKINGCHNIIDDADFDGVADSVDNCPDAANSGQWDKDNDGVGNECDFDIDGDGVSNVKEIANGTKVWDPLSH